MRWQFVSAPFLFVRVFQNADFVAHNVFFPFGLDAVYQIIKDHLHGPAPLLAWVLVDGGLNDVLAHHADSGGDGVKYDHHDIAAVFGHDSPGGAVRTGRNDEQRIGFRVFLQELPGFFIGNHVIVFVFVNPCKLEVFGLFEDFEESLQPLAMALHA